MVKKISDQGNVQSEKHVSGEMFSRGILCRGIFRSEKYPLGKCQLGICPQGSVNQGNVQSGNCLHTLQRTTTLSIM